jgi:hypothetical protein
VSQASVKPKRRVLHGEFQSADRPHHLAAQFVSLPMLPPLVGVGRLPTGHVIYIMSNVPTAELEVRHRGK